MYVSCTVNGRFSSHLNGTIRLVRHIKLASQQPSKELSPPPPTNKKILIGSEKRRQNLQSVELANIMARDFKFTAFKLPSTTTTLNYWRKKNCNTSIYTNIAEAAVTM